MSTIYGPPPQLGEETGQGTLSTVAKRLLFSMGYTYCCLVLVVLNVALLAWVRYTIS